MTTAVQQHKTQHAEPVNASRHNTALTSMEDAWRAYLREHPWMNQPGYISPALRKRAPKSNDSKYTEWLRSCGFAPYTDTHTRVPRAASTSTPSYTNAHSTGQYDYDGNLTALTLAEVARAFDIGLPCPIASLNGDDNVPDTPYVTTNKAVAHDLLKHGVPLQPPLDERTAKRCGTYVFLNPGNTTAAAAWWPSLSASEQEAIKSRYEVWWLAIQRLQVNHVSETYQPERYKTMVRVKRDTERRVCNVVNYPGEQRNHQGVITRCPTHTDLARHEVEYVVRYDEHGDMVANGLTMVDDTGKALRCGEERPDVQRHGTFSHEYLLECLQRQWGAQRGTSDPTHTPDEGATCWWEPSADFLDDALNRVYLADLGIKDALRLAWACGTNHQHKDGMRRCMAMVEWAQRLLGNYVAEALLDYFDGELLGSQPPTAHDDLRNLCGHERFKGERKLEWREEAHHWLKQDNARTRTYLKPESPKLPASVSPSAPTDVSQTGPHPHAA